MLRGRARLRLARPFSRQWNVGPGGVRGPTFPLAQSIMKAPTEAPPACPGNGRATRAGGRPGSRLAGFGRIDLGRPVLAMATMVTLTRVRGRWPRDQGSLERRTGRPGARLDDLPAGSFRTEARNWTCVPGRYGRTRHRRNCSARRQSAGDEGIGAKGHGSTPPITADRFDPAKSPGCYTGADNEGRGNRGRGAATATLPFRDEERPRKDLPTADSVGSLLSLE